ncbi:MAG: hypothetical protein IJ574_02685 [Bacilli bacterium]|nr:hypothetical protein [Bacilli bacterium]
MYGYNDEMAFDYEQVNSCVRRLEGHLNDLTGKNEKLRSLLDYIKEVWQSLSADQAYQELSEMLDLVNQTITNLEKLVDRYQRQLDRLSDYV